MIQRHGMVSLAASKIKRTYVKNAMPDGTQSSYRFATYFLPAVCRADDHPHFLNLVTKLADTLRNTIFVDQVCCSVHLHEAHA